MTDQLPGMEADTRLSVVGVRVDLAGEFHTLGEAVTVTVKGRVILIGEELLDGGGRRALVKIKADTVEVS